MTNQPPSRQSGVRGWLVTAVCVVLIWVVGGLTAIAIKHRLPTDDEAASHNAASQRVTGSDPIPRTQSGNPNDWGSNYRHFIGAPTHVTGPAGGCRDMVTHHLEVVPGGYRVECVAGVLNVPGHTRAQAATTFGLTRPDQRLIQISIPAARGHYLETLWHEAGHAVQYDYFTHADENALLAVTHQKDELGSYERNALEQWARGFASCLGKQHNHSYPAAVPCSFVTSMHNEIRQRTGVDITRTGAARWSSH